MYFLDEKRIAEQDIFNAKYVINIRDQFFAGKKEFGLKVWYLLMFQMWYEKWMNWKSIEKQNHIDVLDTDKIFYPNEKNIDQIVSVSLQKQGDSII